MPNTQIIGILNITPDSFSDGGRFLQTNDAVRRALTLIEDGTSMIDIGAESTRCLATPISQEEEWCRLKDVLHEIVGIAHNAGVSVSVDTRNAKTAAKALELGVDCINDVSGLEDPDMIAVLKNSNASIIIMHNLGIPTSKQRVMPMEPGDSLITEIVKWLEVRAAMMMSENIDRSRIIVDPGVGFGKTPEQSWYVIRNAIRFKEMGFPVCIGHSRKSVFSIIPIALEDRDYPTAVVSAFLCQQNIDFVRVHNVSSHKTTLDLSQRLFT